MDWHLHQNHREEMVLPADKVFLGRQKGEGGEKKKKRCLHSLIYPSYNDEEWRPREVTYP